ncbi:hypothetical protein RND81_07G017900 [Saponaria officinalis]|uniref:DUF7769 domain-containing protein n=1 Tax=Saponaria officinalis TaxID=3572 RepID=A0AAW1JLG1_SAPOF
MRGPNLRDDERIKTVTILFEELTDGKAKYRRITELAAEFQVNRRTITNLWNQAKKQRDDEIPISVNSRIPGKTSKEAQICPTERIAAVELSKRSTVRSLAGEIGCHPSIVNRRVRKGLIRSHTSAIHPQLTQDNKFLRLHFCNGKIVF